MRASLILSAATLAIALAAMPPGEAADTPNAADLINSLTPPPDQPLLRRGIHSGGLAPEAPTAPNAPHSGQANLNVPFSSGSSDISPAAAHVLDQLGQALSSPNLADFKFRVEGHTDTVGAPDMNKSLSEQRAASVTNYLVTKFNIERSRLTPIGMGEDGLLIQTGPDVANSANRRVLVVNLGH